VGVDYASEDESPERRHLLEQRLPIRLDAVSKIKTHSQFCSLMAALDPPFVAYAYGFLAGQLQSRLPLRVISLDDIPSTIPVSLFWHPLSDQAQEQIWLRATIRMALSRIRKTMGSSPYVIWQAEA
jgi:hypothetical protein